jgi:hypothetical protein
MAQQTAVEWLVEQLRLPTNIRFTDDEKYSYKELIEQAKEMEKQQIIKAHDDGDVWSGEKYYTQNYGK